MQDSINRNAVRRFTEVVLNQGEIEAMTQFFWEDATEEVTLPGYSRGLHGLKQLLRGLRRSFPDMHWTIYEQVCEVDKVVSRFEWTGTHQGVFLGLPPTGRAVRVWGMTVDRFERGKIKETRVIMDTLTLLMQLGAVPPPRV